MLADPLFPVVAALLLMLTSCSAAPEPTDTDSPQLPTTSSTPTSTAATPTAATPTAATPSVTPEASVDEAELVDFPVACADLVTSAHAADPIYSGTVLAPRLDESRTGQISDGRWVVVIPTTYTMVDGTVVETTIYCASENEPSVAVITEGSLAVYTVDDAWPQWVQTLLPRIGYDG